MALNDFQILQKIGEGAYSTVHKVKRISDSKIYALKQYLSHQSTQVKINNLKQKQKQNALNEIRLLASISCEHIIKYKESFFDQKSCSLCLIVEFAQNGDLQKLIIKNKSEMKWLAEKQIWKIAKHVLTALHALHQKQIIHRDLKPANIFITKGGYKIADLNVSKLLKQNLAYTQIGTPYYASPEVWQDKPYQLKSDVWSLGCILYEAAALRPPFTATSMDSLYKKVIKGVYPRLSSNYSLHLQNFINKCLQATASKRPSTKNLLSMLPENVDQSQNGDPQKIPSQINLLQTIKVPKNLKSWKHDLPKANYQNQRIENDSLYSIQNYVQSKNFKNERNLAQNKFKQLMNTKNSSRNFIDKRQSLKKINPEHQTYESIKSKIQTEHYELPDSQSSIYSKEKEFMPKINKIYSDAVNDIQNDRKINENRNRVQEILNKMKQAEKKKYTYNRPVWWG